MTMWPFDKKHAEMQAKIIGRPATVIVGGRKIRNITGERVLAMKRRRDVLAATLARINVETPKFKQTARYRKYVEEHDELTKILDGLEG